MADVLTNIQPVLTNKMTCPVYFNIAPQDSDPPYCVWQLISNSPFNSLSCVPDCDSQRVQVDIYASDPINSRDLATDARDALEQDHTIVAGPSSIPVDNDLRVHRWTMDALVFHRRSS